MTVLTNNQEDFWKKNGYLVVTDFFSHEKVLELQSWVAELAAWPETPGKWMKYFERSLGSEKSKLLCRVENFLPYHDGLRQLICGDKIMSILNTLMTEKAVLFKEKINYKMPGGRGFIAHQDAPAFVSFGQNYHITMMIGVDATTIENGCLEIAHGYHNKGLLRQHVDGTLHPELIQELHWQPLTTQPGDIVFFDSYLPHRSGPNQTHSSRRALYITYNKLSEGERREDYFLQKRKAFPPECERDNSQDYSKAGIFNLGNPID